MKTIHVNQHKIEQIKNMEQMNQLSLFKGENQHILS